jgi:DNA-binding beta-propeller fold protein YncE
MFLNKKFLIVIFVIFILFGGSILLTPILFGNLDYQAIKFQKESESSSSATDTVIDYDKKEKNKPGDETTAKITQTQTTSEFTDPAGQLVHHLFDINNIPSPKALVFSPDGKEIWTTMLLNKKRGAAVINSLTGENLKDIDLAGGGGVELVFSRDGKKIYISQMETNQVFEIDSASKEVLRIFDTKGAWTKFLALSSDGKILFASNWSDNNISEIDLDKGQTNRLIHTVKTPRGIYATKDGNYLYVAGFGNGEIEKIDLKTGLGKVIYKSNGAMRHIAADEEKGILFISDMGMNAIFQLSLKDDMVKKFANADLNPNTIALSPDKKVLFVSCRGANASADNYYIPGPEWGSVLLFDAESGKMLDAIVGGNQPTALDISPDGKLLAFSDFLDSRIEVFEIPPYETLKNGNGGRSNLYKNDLHK